MALDDCARHLRWYGRPGPPAPSRHLVAGPLSLVVEGIDVRRVAYGGVPVMDRIFVAIRDPDWGTIPAVLEAPWAIDEADDRVTVAFRARHEGAGIRFRWDGRITVGPGPTVSMAMDGLAEASFGYARMGLCALLPASSMAGHPIASIGPDGSLRRDTLPAAVGPQPLVDGVDQPLVPAFATLDVTLPGMVVRQTFEGDRFELEDQRNWTDDSFKAYSLMDGEPYPRSARPGQRFRQRVSVTVVPTASPAAEERHAILIGEEASREMAVRVTDERLRWPRIGLGDASDALPLDARERAALRALRLDHLRTEVVVGGPGWETRLERAARDARDLDAALELALSLDADSMPLLSRVGDLVEGVPVARVLAFHRPTQGTATTPPGWLARTCDALGDALPGARWVLGTDGDFAEVNRDRPDPAGPDAADGVCYSINPQIHASDERSMAETLPAQGATVSTARSWFGARDVCVTPVTLRQRFNPAARSPDAPAQDDPSPEPGVAPGVDVRQRSLFGAAWTLGSVAALTLAGATSVTWHETLGWRGLAERSRPPLRPGWWPTVAGEVFPMWLVFADLAERQTLDPVRCALQDGRDVAVLGMRGATGARVLVANLTPRTMSVRIAGLPGDGAQVVTLDASTPMGTLGDALDQRARRSVAVLDGVVTLELAEFATVRIDGAGG